MLLCADEINAALQRHEVDNYAYHYDDATCAPTTSWIASSKPGSESWYFDSPSENSLDAIIRDSKKLLQLEENWDDDGASAIAPATWRRAVEFLSNHFSVIRGLTDADIRLPNILPGPDASVDLHWTDTDNYNELLVNIPANPDSLVSFYGDNRGSLYIKGTCTPDRIHWGIIDWLIPR